MCEGDSSQVMNDVRTALEMFLICCLSLARRVAFHKKMTSHFNSEEHEKVS